MSHYLTVDDLTVRGPLDTSLKKGMRWLVPATVHVSWLTRLSEAVAIALGVPGICQHMFNLVTPGGEKCSFASATALSGTVLDQTVQTSLVPRL